MLKSSTPEVSVLIPVRDGEKWISDAILSVLDQTFSDLEVVVINDHSRDHTMDIVRRLCTEDRRVRCYESTGKTGVANSLNFGLSKCLGPVVARLDADDTMERERLSIQLECLSDSRVVLVGSDILRVSESGQAISRSHLPESRRQILRWLRSGRSPLAHPAVTFRREAVVAVGSYNGSFEHAEDFELWCRLQRVGQLVNVPQTLTRYRVHDSQVSQTKAHQQQLSTLWASRQHFPGSSGLLGFVRNGNLSDGDLELLATLLRATPLSEPDEAFVRHELIV